MTNRSEATVLATSPGEDSTIKHPDAASSIAEIARRRTVFVIVNVLTYVVFLAAVAYVLASGGLTVAEIVALLCIALAAPWTILGFWNSLIGLWLAHGHADGLTAAAPYARAGDADAPLAVRTAILMTMRNEDPARALARMRIIKHSLDATGCGTDFDYFLLSDTDDPEIAAAEQQLVHAWASENKGVARIVYRRRELNSGYKAGNLRDFCTRWGDDYELMVPLDADSLMTGDAIVRLVRIMQAHPRIGILQSLVVGLPSQSAFARIFQFGMRHGMRAYTLGQAWWVADCGPFWGHNAAVRIKPFVDHCALPLLPGQPPLGGPILSHDQVEAVLMRRAGYEVRVLPLEDGSYEENPPTMLDFAARDQRWCQGNMQYVHLLKLSGLAPVSRFQLMWAIAMFAGLPAFTLAMALLPLIAWQSLGVVGFPAALAALLYAIFLLMQLTPKLAGLIDTALTAGGVKRYGGSSRFLASATIEIVFSFLQGAISALRTSLFMIGLVFGKSTHWSGQERDAYGISWARAAQHLWPQTLFGLVLVFALCAVSPTVLIWSLPLILGYVVAIPFAVITSWPSVGQAMQRSGLAAIPEDIAPPAEVAALGMDAAK